MQRVENELVNRITAGNVIDLLIKMYPHLKRESKHRKVVDDDQDQDLQDLDTQVKQKFEE
jgi:molybdopterin converting factor small subunit